MGNLRTSLESEAQTVRKIKYNLCNIVFNLLPLNLSKVVLDYGIKGSFITMACSIFNAQVQTTWMTHVLMLHPFSINTYEELQGGTCDPPPYLL